MSSVGSSARSLCPASAFEQVRTAPPTSGYEWRRAPLEHGARRLLGGDDDRRDASAGPRPVAGEDEAADAGLDRRPPGPELLGRHLPAEHGAALVEREAPGGVCR